MFDRYFWPFAISGGTIAPQLCQYWWQKCHLQTLGRLHGIWAALQLDLLPNMLQWWLWKQVEASEIKQKEVEVVGIKQKQVESSKVKWKEVGASTEQRRMARRQRKLSLLSHINVYTGRGEHI